MTDEEIRAFLAGAGRGGAEVRRVSYPPLAQPAAGTKVRASLSHLDDVQLEISVELGQTSLKVKEVLALEEGSVIRLDKPVGDAVEVILNGQRFAKGEVVVINDAFGVRLTAVNEPHHASLSEGLL